MTGFFDLPREIRLEILSLACLIPSQNLQDNIIRPATANLTISSLFTFVEYLQNLAIVFRTLDSCDLHVDIALRVSDVFEGDVRETKVVVGTLIADDIQALWRVGNPNFDVRDWHARYASKYDEIPDAVHVYNSIRSAVRLREVLFCISLLAGIVRFPFVGLEVGMSNWVWGVPARW